MNKSVQGILLIVAALAGLGWLWWRRRQPATADGPEAPGPIATVTGSTVNADYTPEILKTTLEFTDKVITKQNCWSFDYGKDGFYYFKNAAGQKDVRPVGQYPANYCGNLLP